MKYLDRDCENVLRAMIKIKQSGYLAATIDGINILTKAKYAKNNQFQTIIRHLIDEKYIFIAADPNTNVAYFPESYALFREGEIYFNEKRMNVLRGAIGWVGYAVACAIGAIGGALITWLLSK